MNKSDATGEKTEYRGYRISYEKKNRRLVVECVSDFDPVHIFECGQCFRWTREDDGSYTGIADGRPVSVRFEEGRLTVENCGAGDFENFWYDYFDLGRDYASVKKYLMEKDEVMRRAVDFGGGIRLLRQDPWETVVSFIISQNSNIPRIRRCVELLCSNFGEPLGEWRGKKRFGFPAPERLAELSREDLAVCRLGYRDKYVIGAAQAVAGDNGRTLTAARYADQEEALKYILTLPGAGPKVASCIMLFGLLHYGSFPLDVWMKRIMSELYGYELQDVKGMSEYARIHFGEYSGFAQQYLFYYAKENLKKDIDNKRQKR